MSSSDGLRTRKRVAMMQRIQRIALQLFERDGFDGVTMEMIAAKADVGVATIYRHFGTKDQIVIWDDADEGQATRLFTHIARGSLAAALLRFATVLDEADTEVRQSVIARMVLISKEPALRAQAAINATRFGDHIAAALARKTNSRAPSSAQDAVGQAAAAILSAAIIAWAQNGARLSLRRLVADAITGVKEQLAD